MKAIGIATLGAALCFVSVSCATPQTPPPQQPATTQQAPPQQGPDGTARGGGGGGGMMLFNGIALSDAQKAQIDSIRAKYRAQMPPRTPGTPPDEATREKRRAMMRAQTDEMRALLTDDQKKTFDANLAEMQSRMPQRPPAPPQS